MECFPQEGNSLGCRWEIFLASCRPWHIWWRIYMNKLMPKECRAGQEISVCAEGLGLFQHPGTWIFKSWGKEGLGLWPLLGFFPSALYFEFYYSGSDHFWCCISTHNKKQFFFSVSATWKEHPSFVRRRKKWGHAFPSPHKLLKNQVFLQQKWIK